MSNRVKGVEHFWAAEANYREVKEMEGYPILPYPIAYQVPVTTLVTEGNPVMLHSYARTVTCDCELCFVMARPAYDVPVEQAADYVKEYRVLAAFRDYSVVDYLGREAPARETISWSLQLSRWADSMHCLSLASLPAGGSESPYSSPSRLSVDGVGEVTTSTSDYLHHAADVIATLSRAIALQAGDVISLGRAGGVLTIPLDRRLPEGARVRASIDGVGELDTPVHDLRQPREIKPPTFWWL